MRGREIFIDRSLTYVQSLLSLAAAVRAVSPFMKRMQKLEQEQYLDDYVAHTQRLGLMENPHDAEKDIRVRVTTPCWLCLHENRICMLGITLIY